MDANRPESSKPLFLKHHCSLTPPIGFNNSTQEEEIAIQMHGGDCGGGALLCSGNEVLPATVAAPLIRKGPWLVEEDAVLMDYVAKYGPHDWSSIRSKGLLFRSGKSCRLRYVNKLKPGLKSGCKFSAEEERVVIDLQARFGNKWARISTHLPGRTDNDVKNFWSIRQKRLAKLLQTSSPVRPLIKQRKANGNSDYYPYNVPQYPNSEHMYEPYYEGPDAMKMVVMPNNPEANLPQIEPAINAQEPCLQSSSPPPPSPFDNFLDLPLLSDGEDLIMQELGEMSFPDQFDCVETSLTLFDEFEVEDSGIRREHLGTPESFFDDFPAALERIVVDASLFFFKGKNPFFS
ncbi:myb-related protein MYBAS2-like [Phalaenopsis equestris]|uniref:myb-related protein MYBAS2-like n=1 Tax=Phalaenopsis equestris TaxID=78828 RepID=UPI0009E62397|nr:myb-related protein MYBAS2-like [Phalaenopsis equestris]